MTTPNRLRRDLAAAAWLLVCACVDREPPTHVDALEAPSLALPVNEALRPKTPAPSTVRGSPEALARLRHDLDRIHADASALVEAAERRGIWLDEAPSSTSHKLLACGRDCTRTEGDGELWSFWSRSLSRADLHELHRGEVWAIAADLDLPSDTRLLLADGDFTSVGALLDESLAEVLTGRPSWWNEKEAEHGVELGWLRSAACRYLPDAILADPGGFARILDPSPPGPDAVEAGTHELEGLAICAANLGHAGAPILETLERRLAADLANMGEDGQLYANAPNFTSCEDERCRVFANLNRQAHFFEWVAHVPTLEYDPSLARAVRRWRELGEQARALVEAKAELPPLAPLLWASSASHSAHASAWMRDWTLVSQQHQ